MGNICTNIKNFPPDHVWMSNSHPGLPFFTSYTQSTSDALIRIELLANPWTEAEKDVKISCTKPFENKNGHAKVEEGQPHHLCIIKGYQGAASYSPPEKKGKVVHHRKHHHDDHNDLAFDYTKDEEPEKGVSSHRTEKDIHHKRSGHVHDSNHGHGHGKHHHQKIHITYKKESDDEEGEIDTMDSGLVHKDQAPDIKNTIGTLEGKDRNVVPILHPETHLVIGAFDMRTEYCHGKKMLRFYLHKALDNDVKDYPTGPAINVVYGTQLYPFVRFASFLEKPSGRTIWCAHAWTGSLIEDYSMDEAWSSLPLYTCENMGGGKYHSTRMAFNYGAHDFKGWDHLENLHHSKGIGLSEPLSFVAGDTRSKEVNDAAKLQTFKMTTGPHVDPMLVLAMQVVHWRACFFDLGQTILPIFTDTVRGPGCKCCN
jgi:hypothetical protein